MWTPDRLSQLIRQFRERKDLLAAGPGRGSRAHAEQMEPRVMLSIAKAIDAAAPDVRSLAAAQASRPLVFVDAGVARTTNLPADAEVITFVAGADPIATITRELAGRSNVRSVSIVSHGASGALSLGGKSVVRQDLFEKAEELKKWSASLAGDASIALYGCDVASGSGGELFVESLARLTGATVAASTDVTGPAALGGDADLEFVAGDKSDVQSLLAAADFSATLAFAITPSGGTTTHEVSGSATVVDSGVVVTASGDTSTTALVRIATNYRNGEDVLAVSYGGITPVFTAGTGTLSLTSAGALTAAQWEAVFRAVTFTTATSAPNLTARGITFTIGSTTSAGKSLTPDLPVDTATQDRIVEALDVVEAIGTKIGTFSGANAGLNNDTEVPFTGGLKVTDLFYPNSADLDSNGNPVTDWGRSVQPHQIGSYLALSDAADNYFNAAGTITDLAGLKAALEARLTSIVPGTSAVRNVTVAFSKPAASDARSITITIAIANTRGDDISLDLPDLQRDLGLYLPTPPTITVGGGADIEFSISVDLQGHTYGSTLAQNKTTLAFTRLNALAGFTFSNVTTTAEFGLIRGQLVGASGVVGAKIPVSFSGATSRTLNSWATDGSDVTAFSGTLSGTANLDLPVTASLGGVAATTANSKIVVVDSNIFDDTAPSYTTTDFSNVLYFSTLKVEDVIGEILKVKDLYTTLANSDDALFGVNVPFLKDKTLGELFDFGSLFQSAIGAKVDIVEPVLNTPGRDALTDYRLPLSSDSTPVPSMWSDLRAAFKFGVVVNNTWPIVTVTVAADNTRETLADLITDVNAALTTAGLQIQASNISGKMSLKATNVAVQKFAIVPVAPDAARLNPTAPASDLTTLTLNQAYYYTVTGTTTGTVTGTNYYTTATPVAAAAVHAGILASGTTGVVKVTRVGAMPVVWGSQRNGITSGAAVLTGNAYLIESAESDLRRLGIVDYGSELTALDQYTEGRVRASLALPADLSTNAQFVVTSGNESVTVDILDQSRTSVADTLADVQAAMATAGLTGKLAARLIDSDNQVLTGEPEVGEDYRLELYLPEGGAWTEFDIEPASDVAAYRMVALGFLVGDVSATPRPSSLRTFEDFSNGGLFPTISITPVYDAVAGTVTLQFAATGTSTPTVDAGFDFNPDPVGRIKPTNQSLTFTPTVNSDIAFGLEFKLGPANPIFFASAEAVPANGRLTTDAHFDLEFVLQDKFAVTVPATWTSANNNVQDLVADINRALKQAVPSGGGTADLTSDRMIARRQLDSDKLELITATPANGGSATAISHTAGVLSSDLTFAVTYDGDSYLVTVPAADTTTNTSFADLVLDLNAALSTVTLDADIDGVIDSDEATLSLADKLFFTTIATAAGASDSNVYLFATSPGSTAWPATITLSASRTDSAVTELGFDDGADGDLSSSTARASGTTSYLRNHTNGSALAGGSLALTVPTFAGSVTYGFNKLDFASISGGSVAAEMDVLIGSGVDAGSTLISNSPASYLDRTLTGAGGAGNAAAAITLEDITSGSADIDNNAAIAISIADISDTTAIVEIPVGVPIPVPGQVNGVLTSTGTVNFLYEGAKYTVSVLAANTTTNASVADLAADFSAALSSVTRTVSGVPALGFNASSMFTITAGDDALIVSAKTPTANPDFAVASFVPGLSAFGEVGLQGAFGPATVAQALADVMPVMDTLQSQMDAFANIPLPLVELTLNDLIDIKGDMLRRIESFRDMSVTTPEQIATALSAAFSIPTDYVSVAFDSANNAYRIDLKVETGVATEKPLDLTLADFYRFTNDTAPEGLSRLVDTGSRSPLTVKIKSTSVLSIGIDLTDPDAPRTFLYGHDGSDDLDLENGTSVQLAIEASADGINFTAATGAFGVFVRDGNATLGGPVVTSGGQPVYTFDEDTNQLHFARQGTAATLTVTLGGNDGKFYLDPAGVEKDAFDLDNFEAVFEGTAEVNLPMFTPTELMNPFTNRTVNVRIQGTGLTDVHPGGNVMSLHIGDLQAYADHVLEAVDLQNQISDIYTTAGGNPNGAQQNAIDSLTADLTDLRDGGAVEIFTPDVEDANSGIKAPTLLDILRDPAILVDPLDILFGTIETGLRALDNLNIPVIGPALGDAVDDVFGWRTGWLLDLRNNMRGKGEAVFESIKESIYNVLGPGGIDLLLKDNGIRSVDGMVQADSMDDVGLDFLDEDGNKMTGLGGYGAHAVEFKLRLGQTLLDTGADISFNFDALAPAFTLGVDGGLSFKLGWDMTFGFGYSIDDGFYVVTDSNPVANELELRFEAGLRGDGYHFQVAEKSDSPTGYAIKDKDGNWVRGPRKGDGSRDIINVLPVDETGTPLDGNDLANVQMPQEVCDDDSLSAAGPGFDEEVYWVVAAQDGSDWVPAYIDKLGFYRPQQGATWAAINGGDDEFNPDQMIEYNQTAPFNGFGSLFFLNLSATDKPKIGLGALGDAEYFYDPSEASTITSNGRNDDEFGVNRNNSLPTRIAGRIGINLKDPSDEAGGYVARPGPSLTGFLLMDGSNPLGGEPVLDDDGNTIPVLLNEDDNDTWYTIKPAEGVTNPTTLADYEFDAPINEDPSENRITWGELRQGGTGLFEFVLNAEAVVNLSMVLTVSEDANIPRLTADFNLDWRTDSMTPPANPFDTTTEQKRDLVPEVGMNNIRLDLGSFLTKLIKPIAVEVDKTLKPIDPLISAIQTKIPVISDIAGRPIKLTTLLYTFGGPKGQAVATLIEMAILVRELSGVMAAVPDDANVYLPIGNFWLAKISSGPLGQPGMGKTIYYDNSEVSAPSITQRNQSLIADPGAGLNSVTNAMGKLDAQDKESSSQPGISNPNDKGGFSIPILEDPITIFKLLMGEDVPLVTYSLPKLNFSFEQSIPLVRIICFEAGIRLNLQMKGQLAMGYDTRGIRMFKDSGDPADLMQGFYVSDRANADGSGADVDEFWFRASIAIYGEIDLYLAKGGIEGGFALTGSVNLNDPNNDGKLRVVEAYDLVKYTGNPLDLADLSLSGEVYARYYYWVGLKIWTPWKTYKITLYSGGKTFARLELFNVSREGNDGPPTFAGVVTTINPDGTENPSTLLINAGPAAEKRVSNQDPLKALDGAERFRIWNETPGSNTVKVQYKNWDQNYTQTYNNVSRVVVYGGEYDDYIDASALNGIPVEIDGGNGNDTILLGNAATGSQSILTGGNGNDVITAGGGNLRIEGNGGNDTITAGSGTNEIDPGDGNDTVTGGGSGSTNKLFLRRSFGKDTVTLDTAALINLLDYVDSTLPLVGTLQGAGSTIYAGDTNVTTFSLGAVTEIRGSEGRDVFNITNPTTRNANNGKGLILRGHESVDTYNFVGDTMSGVATDGITIDDGIRPTSTATIGDITLSDPCKKIKEIKVATGGASYASAPEVVITDDGGTGTGARAVASLDKDGKVQGIYVLDGGEDYTDPVVALVDRVSYGDKMIFTSTTAGAVTLDKQGNGGSDYRITSGGKSIKFAGWTTPGVPRPKTWNVSETDNVEINLPNGTLELNDHLDIQESLTVTAKRMDLNAAITADTVKITTERGFALDHPIQAVNNGDISIRVSGKNIGSPSDIATAAATVVDGEVTGITVTNPGAHYDFAPVVAIVDERGYAARAVATINGSGQVTGITVLDGGFGYLSTPAPRVIISPPASIRLAANVSSSTVGSDPGAGDGRGQITLQADLGAIVNMGEVFFPNGSNIEFKHGDFRYKSTDSLDDITTTAFPTTAGGQGAAATAVLDADGRIERIDVTNGGSGYDADLLPTVIIQGAGTATAIVSGGQITGFKITNPGEGYPSAPTVTILPNGFGKIVGEDSDATALNRTHIKSAGGSLKAISYYGIGDPSRPIKTDVDRLVAQTLGDGAGINILEKDGVRIGTIDHVNGISTIDGDVAVTTFAGTLHLGQPVQAMNANGMLLWQDAAKTIPIYVRDNAGNIIYEGGQLQTGVGQIKLTADDVDINSFVGATGGQLILQPVKFDAPIGLNGTQGRATVSVSGPTGSVSINTLYSGRGYTTTPMVTLPAPGERAYGVANVVNGAVQSALVTFGGKRYNSTYQPIVTFVGGGQNGGTPGSNGTPGTAATATAAYDADGVVTGITITGGGTGYITAPELRISLPGVQATAVATVIDGRISGITFTNPGANYAEPPQIKIEAPYQFSLEAEEVQYLEDGFREVVIGRDDGSHTFQAANASFNDAVRLRAPRTGGTMQVESLSVDAGPVVIVGSGHTLNMTSAAPNVTGTYVEVDDNIVIHDNVNAAITATTAHVLIFGVGKGKIDGVANSLTENLTITDVGDVTVTGAIGSTNPIHDLTINSSGAGNIALQQAVTIEGDLHIVKGGNITFGGALTVGGNLIIDDGASVSFNGTVSVGGNMTISKATTVAFAQNVSVVGNLLMGNSSDPTKLQAVTFANNARMDVDGTVQIYADEDISFGNRVGNTKVPDSVTLRSDTGSISFAAQVVVTGGTLTIQKSDDVTFGHDVTVGTLSVTAAGETRFNRAVNAGTLDVLSQELVVFSNQLNISTGNATITADEVDFAGNSSTIKTVGAAINNAVLTIKPYTAGRNIGIGSPPAVFGVMDMNDTDLAAIATGWAQVHIGDETAGTGTVTVGSIGTQQGGTISYLANNTAIHGGNITVVQPVDMALSTGTLRLHARTGDVTTNAVLNGTALERGSIVRIEADAGNINLNQPVYATSEIQLIASGNVTEGASSFVSTSGLRVTAGGSITMLHASNAVTTVTMAAADDPMQFREDSGYAIGTVNGQSGMSAGTGNITLTTIGGVVTQTQAIVAGGLSLQGANTTWTLVNAGNDIDTLTANTGKVTFLDSDDLTVGTIGSSSGITVTDDVTLSSVQALTVNNAVTTSGPGDVSLTSTAANVLINANGDISSAQTIGIAAVTGIASSGDLIAANGAITLSATAGTINTSGVVTATSGGVSYTATGAVTVTAAVTTVTSGNISLTSSTDVVNLGAAGDLLSVGTIAVAGYAGVDSDADMTSAGATGVTSANAGIDLSGNSVTTNGAVTHSANTTLAITGSTTAGGANGAVSLTSVTSSITLGAAADISAAKTITAAAVTDFISSADLTTAAGAIGVTVSAGTLSSAGVVSATAGNAGFTATGNVAMTGPVTTVTSGNVSLTSSAGQVTTSAAADLLSAGTIAVAAFAGATLTGDMTAAGAVSANVANGSAYIDGKTQTTNGAVTFVAQDSLDLLGTITAAGASGNVVLTSNGFVVVLQGSADIVASGTITATAADNVNNMADWTAAGAIIATATNGGVSSSGTIVSSGSSVAFSGPVVSNDGPINASTSIAMTASDTVSNTATLTSGTTTSLSGTNTVTTSAAISAGSDVTITGNDIAASTSITTTNDNVTFTGRVTLPGNLTITTGAGAGNISFSDTVDGPGGLDLTAGTGNITFDSDVGDMGQRPAFLTIHSATVAHFDRGANTTGAQSMTAGTVELGGTFDASTNLASITINAVLSLHGSARVSTQNGTVSVASIVGNSNHFVFSTGAGTATVTGDATGIDILHFHDENGNNTGTMNFLGNVQAQSLSAARENFSINFLGDSTEITNHVGLQNMGVATFGDESTDEIHLIGGLTAAGGANNPASVHLAGTLTTDAAAVILGVTILDTDAAIDTTHAGNGGAIDFTGTLNGTHNLRLNSGNATIDFDAAVGATNALAAVTIDAHAGLTAHSTFTAASITQTAATGATTFTGAVATSAAGGINLTGLDLTFGNTVTTTTGGVTIDGEDVLFSGAVDSDGNIAITATGSSTFNAAVLGSGATGITVNAASSAFNSTATTDNDGSINVTTTGDAHFGGAVNSDANLVVSGDDVDFDAAVTTAGSTGIDITAGTVDFDAAVATTGDGFMDIVATGLVNFDSTVNVAGANGIIIDATDITFLGAVTTPGEVILDHTGTLTIAAAADFSIGGAFSQTGAGAVSTAGDITTTNDTVSFNGPVTLTGNVAIATAGGAIDFDSTLNGSHTLLLTAGTGDITTHAAVGGLTPLGAVTIASADDVTLMAGFASTNLTQVAGSGTTSVQGLLSTTGLAGVSITADTIEVTATGDITTAGGSVDLNADTGTLTIVDGATVNAGSGTITIESVGDATITGLTTTNATASAVSITSNTGAIIDAGETTADITANASGATTRLRAAGNIGASTDGLETNLATLDAAVTTAGDIYMSDAGAITLASVTSPSGDIAITAAGTMSAQLVDAVSGTVTLRTTAGNLLIGDVSASDSVNATSEAGSILDNGESGTDGVTSPVVELASFSGIGTTGARLVVVTDDLTALVEHPTTHAATNGDIYIASTSLAGPLAVRNLSTATGTIDLSHTGSDAEVELASTSGGSIAISVADGTLTATSVTAGGSGNVNLSTTTADEDVLVGSVTADGNAVTITSAGSIVESGDDVGVDLLTSSLTLTAAGSVGEDSNPIEINADQLSAEADGIAGGIFLTETDDVVVTKLVASGDITLAAGGIIALNSTGTIRSDENLNGAHDAVSRNISFLGAVELLRNTAITTGTADGSIRFADTLGGAHTLTLTMNDGAIDFDGVIGTGVTPVTALTVSSASVVTFADDVHVGTGGLSVTASVGVTFDGDSTVNGNVGLNVNNADNTGSVNVNGDFTTTNGGNFIVNHDGTATFADGIVFDIAGDTRFTGTGRVEFGSITYNTGGDIEFNQGPLVLTSNTVIDTGTGGGDVIFRDEVRGGYDLTIIGSGGDVLFEQAAGTTGEPLATLTITGADDITFQQGVVTSGDVNLTATGDVVFAGTLDSGESIDISATGVVSFADQVNAEAGLVVTSGGALTFTETVTVASGTTDLTHGGTLTIPTGADFNLGGEFHEHGTGSVVLGEVSITTSDDDITFDGDISLTGAATFDTGDGPGDVTFNGSINGHHTIVVTAGTGDVRFDEVGQTVAVDTVTVEGAAITLVDRFNTAIGADLLFTATGDISFGTATDVSVGGLVEITTSALFDMAAGSSLTAREGDDIVITANDVSLTGGTGSVTGTGLLILQPLDNSRGIVVGTLGVASVQAAGSTLQIGASEIAALGSGFDAVLVGRGTQGGYDSGEDGDHTITVYNATFSSDFYLRSPGEEGQIRVSGNLRGLSDVNLELWAGDDILVDGTVRATGSGNITIHADSTEDGVGAVRIAQSGDASVRAELGDVLLIGDSVWAGSTGGAAEVSSRDGTVQLSSTDAEEGQIFVFNDRSLMSAGIDVLVGSPETPENSPSFIRVEGNVLAGRHIWARSRGPIELGNFRLRARGVVSVLADGDLRMENGTAVGQGGPVNLIADADADGTGTPIQTDVRVSETGDVNLSVRVNSVKIKGVLSAGDKGKAWVTVTNNAATTMEGNVRVFLYASLDGELDASDAIIGQYAKVLKLKPGAGKKLSFAIAVPADLPPGDYRIIGEVLPYRADRPAAAAPTTANDSNVDASGLLLRVRRPDLTASVRSSFDGGTFAAGRVGKVTISVANQGEVPSVGNGTVVLYATPDGTLGSAVEVTRLTTALALKAGKAKAVNLKVSLPGSLAGGTWKWLAVVNPDGAVAEADLSNNSGVAGSAFNMAA